MPRFAPSIPPPEKKGEHIFSATHLTALAIRWQQLNKVATAAETMGNPDRLQRAEADQLLEDIIVGSTSMFERLAQHEGFTFTVDLDTLVQAAREKVLRWLLAWDPSKPIFSFFSVCARHAFLSEVNKVNSHRKRFHATSDSLEKFFGEEDHDTFKEDAAEEVRRKLLTITVRWGDTNSQGAIRYVLACLTDGVECERATVVRSICYGFGLSEELGKFFYSWGLFALRDALYKRVRMPFTQQDLFRHRETFSHLVDLLDIISWDQFQRMVATLGGQRLKIPTVSQLGRLHDDWLLAKDVEENDGGPEALEAAAKKHGRSTRAAGEIYEEMQLNTSPDRDGEHDLYPAEV